MFRRREVTYRVIAVDLVLAFGLCACGSGQSSGGGPMTTVAGPSTSSPLGRPALEVTDNAPFSIVVSPAEASPGTELTVTTSGSPTDPWLGGPDVFIDQQVNGSWLSRWMLLDSQYGGGAFVLDERATPPTIPAVGLLPATPLVLTLPNNIDVGEYRICRDFVTSAGQKAYLCAPLAIVG